MKYKVGQKVKIRSLEWYRDNVNRYGIIECGKYEFFEPMNEYCGKVVTIKRIDEDNYRIDTDKGAFCWTDEMFEGLAEEETIHNKWTGLKVELELSKTVIGVSNVESVNGERFMSGFVKAIIPPEDCQFVDENGNVINATKIVLEKKKKEYPKTYEECCKVLNVAVRDLDILDNMLDTTEIIYRKNLDRLLNSVRKLLICRDAYWKIAGDEMKLGEPWKPDYDSGVDKHGIIVYNGSIDRCGATTHWGRHLNKVLEFPTKEMRDAFYENFKGLINECKELL